MIIFRVVATIRGPEGDRTGAGDGGSREGGDRRSQEHGPPEGAAIGDELRRSLRALRRRLFTPRLPVQMRFGRFAHKSMRVDS